MMFPLWKRMVLATPPFGPTFSASSPTPIYKPGSFCWCVPVLFIIIDLYTYTYTLGSTLVHADVYTTLFLYFSVLIQYIYIYIYFQISSCFWYPFCFRWRCGQTSLISAYLRMRCESTRQHSQTARDCSLKLAVYSSKTKSCARSFATICPLRQAWDRSRGIEENSMIIERVTKAETAENVTGSRSLMTAHNFHRSMMSCRFPPRVCSPLYEHSLLRVIIIGTLLCIINYK